MRKKKIIVTMILFLCFTGVVSASSIHGEYNGDPIVNVLFGAKELQVEDVPATIRDGRTLVPLYLLKQTGASVAWDSEKYNVDLAIPNPMKDFASNIHSFNEKAKEHSAKNVQLISNEYGLYMKIDLIVSNDSNKDNDNIIFLSSLVANSPADMLIVSKLLNNKVMGFIAINRTDAEEFLKNKTPEFDYIKKWRYQQVNETTDMSTPNIPPVVPTQAPASTAPVSGPICREIMTNYAKQMQDAAESYNGNGSSDPKAFEQYINKFKESMNVALKINHCPEQ
ncbi:copper amine oxidase N-terminal domain-containing protein [Paenibacillus andongensis]|uniref:copper amine oxidase N-terminal domain-containing protein n=1 Tax=Paenibacillus andongensis TaxID=2975482 RepID=UPI0021BAD0F3|nr:copper amine oxidase N-terminal domain-containing protein [Paenibacillus andongensis]